MTEREKLRLLAEIDAMIALRDMVKQRNTQKGRYVAQLMDSAIEMTRQRLRALSAPMDALQTPRCAA